jgi:hypothetical protein
MKLTPLILFLLLLFILIISLLFSKFLPLYGEEEGFISFALDKKTNDYVFIPQYSSSSTTVVKLYDNLFFDTKNGCIIEVDGAGYLVGNTSVSGNTVSGNIDNTGSSISGVYVISRNNNNINHYTQVAYDANHNLVGVNTPESKLSSIFSSYTAYIYNTICKNTDKYTLFYIPYDTQTFLHVIKKGSPPMNAGSYFIDDYGSVSSYQLPSNSSITIGTPEHDNDPNNGTVVIESLYQPSYEIFQFSHTVKFDPHARNLIIKNDKKQTITVYNSSGAIITDYPNNMTNSSSFNVFLVPDNANNMVLCMSHKAYTLIAILYLDGTGNITMDNPFVFNGTTLNVSLQTKKGGQGPNNDYYMWLAYWNTLVNNGDGNIDDNYILKTQVVPPVCPSCPSCSSCQSGGVCSNCGGNGGSGTNGNSYSSGNSYRSNSEIGGLLRDAGSGTTGLLKDAGSEAVDLAKDTASGTVGLAKDTVSGTVGLAKDTVSGTIGLAKDVASGTADFVKDVGSGIAGLGSSSSGQYGQYGQYGQPGQPGQPGQYGKSGQPGQAGVSNIDNYSQYGALSNNSSNFIPITTDFSRFSK